MRFRKFPLQLPDEVPGGLVKMRGEVPEGFRADTL